MALIVEDGTGLSTAESYVSIAWLDTYYTNRVTPTSWSGYSDTQKEQEARMATEYLYDKYTLKWKGWRKTREQALDWPREGVYRREGWTVDNESVPTEVMRAVAEVIAYKLNAAASTLQPSEGGLIKSAKAAVVEVEFMDGKKSENKYPKVDRLLQELTRGPGRVDRG